ncbi:hypothetical protein C2845_PM03G32810 [Panicum miliaceum]|uniref:Transposase (putative) gypsy type domain-containing protein n=1 Tax=Panicum miliaceum TaxID=4540 RepID=A0A3L6TDL0_PANMI|nr:hypothetical protein C2845_PM03G32810 [Panicum miliaceum]
MAASSSSSSVVLDLGKAADGDTTTSAIFFSDSDAAGAASSWPAAEAITSTLTSEGTLRDLLDRYGVPREFKPVWCASNQGWTACTPPPPGSNAISLYTAALDAGLRFPLHDFYGKILRHYGLAPSQLAPERVGVHGRLRPALRGSRRGAAGVRVQALLLHIHPQAPARRPLGVAPLPAPQRQHRPTPLHGQAAHQDGMEVEVLLPPGPGVDPVEVPGEVGQAEEGGRTQAADHAHGNKKAEADGRHGREQAPVSFPAPTPTQPAGFVPDERQAFSAEGGSNMPTTEASKVWETNKENAKLKKDWQDANTNVDELRGKLREAKLWITQYMENLSAANAEIARMKAERGDAAVKEVHDAKANAKLEIMVAENQNFKRLAMFHTKGAMDTKSWCSPASQTLMLLCCSSQSWREAHHRALHLIH